MPRHLSHLPDDSSAEQPRQFNAANTQENGASLDNALLQHSKPQSQQASRTDDAHLVAECLKGNEDAWSVLINKYKRLIYSIPIKYGIAATDAADILQCVCMELFCELPHLRKVESLKSWLIVVTSRKCFHWKRSNRAVVELDSAESEGYAEIGVQPAMEIFEAEKEQCLRDAIAQLAPRCQDLIQMLFYEQPPVPYAEVARRLGLATGSIGFTRGRCLARLQKILKEAGF